MRRSNSVFIAIVAFLSLQNAGAQITHPDTMAHKIFATLKAKDEAGFVALYPNERVMAKLMTKVFAGVKAEMKRKEDSLPKNPIADSVLGGHVLDSVILSELERSISPEQISKMKEGFGSSFRRLVEQGEKRGINWNSVQLVNYTYDTVAAADGEKFFGSAGYKEMKGVFHFTAGDSAYQLPFDNVMYLPEDGGWYGVKLRGLFSEGEQLGSEVWKEKVVELVNIESDEPPPLPPPPPPPKKPKDKTTVKGKTASPKKKQ